VRERSALSDFARTGEPAHAAEFRAARSEERRDFQRLEPLARALDGSVLSYFEKARTVTGIWHRQLHDDELTTRGPAAIAMVETPQMRELFRDVMLATSELDSMIVRTTDQVRARIDRSERVGLLLTFVTGALALLAATTVGWLVWRMRRLADETERRRQQAAAALAESARSAEARTRLLQGITHDVKNPLGAAKGYAELLGLEVKGPLGAEQHKLLEGMQRSIDNALAIISELLDLARADSGGISVQRVDIDLRQLAREAVEDHRPAAQNSGHELHFDGAKGELRIFTDPVRVRQVLDNLISNAIKYTPAPGSIIVRAEQQPAGRDGQVGLALTVSDTGPGIPLDKRELIFNEFTRLDDGGELKGHGLGLAIARRVARILGGELAVADTSGRGATFVLTLPQREPPASRSHQGDSRSVVQRP
jgi:signal transduction histidine kinase